MPSAEEDHDHDLSRHTRRCCGHHHRWIFWTVNAAIGKIHTRRRGVRKREPSAAPVSRRIGPKRWTRHPFRVGRSCRQHHRRDRRREQLLDRWVRHPVVSTSTSSATSSMGPSS